MWIPSTCTEGARQAPVKLRPSPSDTRPPNGGCFLGAHVIRFDDLEHPRIRACAACNIGHVKPHALSIRSRRPSSRRSGGKQQHPFHRHAGQLRCAFTMRASRRRQRTGRHKMADGSRHTQPALKLLAQRKRKFGNGQTAHDTHHRQKLTGLIKAARQTTKGTTSRKARNVRETLQWSSGWQHKIIRTSSGAHSSAVYMGASGERHTDRRDHGAPFELRRVQLARRP